MARSVAGAANPDRPDLQQVGVATTKESGRGPPQICKELWIPTLAEKHSLGASGSQRLCFTIDLGALLVRKLLIDAIGPSRSLLAELTGNATGTLSVAHDGNREVECVNSRVNRHRSPYLAEVTHPNLCSIQLCHILLTVLSRDLLTVRRAFPTVLRKQSNIASYPLDSSEEGMPLDDEPTFIPDRRGNSLERHLFEVTEDQRSHRLLLRASAEIASQFQRMKGGGYTPASYAVSASAGWTHCLQAPGLPAATTRELADLLSEVITLPRMDSVDFAIAMRWYKIPTPGLDPRDWPNTPDGERVHVGKYWTNSPEARAEAGRALVRRLVAVVRRHPTLASADVVVAVPGHDRTYLSFGERIAASVSRLLDLPLINVTTSQEFRPPAKDLPASGNKALLGTFSVEEHLSGARALIVDDVLHTGGTMSAVGSAVMRAGASQASGLAAVRTLRR
ncbi:MAG TPA: phosphoribosyltransferase [Streptosporangiaceae bacterium]|nr:phosphoribosyltransferase [Streptosporangiaceae bacterium]